MSTVLQLRFDETDATIRPQDAIGNLGDLDVEAGLVAPSVVDAACGRGRSFASATTNGMRAQDIIPGSTLLQRNMSIQVIAQWNAAAAAAYGTPGTIYARGKGTAAPEYMDAGLEVRLVNAALSIGELRWIWHDAAGALKTQLGGHFTPAPSGFLLLTATRRWVDSATVVLRYYCGDALLAEVTSADGSIGGGTTGTTSIGARWTGAAWDRYFNGVIDELRVVDYELTQEEIEATFKRITVWQPRGYKLLRELHPPGFPISSDPHSRVQRETNMWGQGLGYAAAQAENVRDNILPDRAYGDILTRWEAITGQAPKPADSVDTRRSRVVGKMRNRAGASIPGLQAALAGLVNTDVANLQFLAFPQELGDFITGHLYSDPQLWTPDPTAQWTFPGGGFTARVQAANLANLLNTGHDLRWYTLLAPVPAAIPLFAEGRSAHLFSKIVPTSISQNGEVGIAFYDWARGNALLMGLRNNAGTYQIVTEVITGWVSSGATVRATSALVNHWLHIYHQGLPAGSVGVGGASWNMTAEWSTTSELAGYTSYTNIPLTPGFQWAALYARGFTSSLTGALDVTFDESRIRCPFGDRSFWFYVFRDPALAGVADVLGAHAVIQGIKHANTKGTIITSRSLLCDDLSSGCDRGPLGGI